MARCTCLIRWCSRWIVFPTSAVMTDRATKMNSKFSFYFLHWKSGIKRMIFAIEYLRKVRCLHIWPEAHQNVSWNVDILLWEMIQTTWIFLCSCHLLVSIFTTMIMYGGKKEKKESQIDRDYIEKGNSICNLLFDRFSFCERVFYFDRHSSTRWIRNKVVLPFNLITFEATFASFVA